MLLYGLQLNTDKQLIEDCIQELFIWVFQKKEKLNAIDDLRIYLFISLKRKLMHKAQRSSSKLASKENYLKQNEPNIFIESIEEKILELDQNAENSQLIKEALQLLPAKMKEAVYLYYYQRLSHKDMAEILNIKTQSSKNLLSKAISRLKRGVFKGYFF